MKYSEARMGRVFTIRLEDGDVVHEAIEKLAGERSIRAGALVILGGGARNSRLVVGPEKGDDRPITPMIRLLEAVHEVAGVGTLFPDESGAPTLHMHMACGRGEETATGCVREGVRVWQVMEAILFELTDTSAARRLDPDLGFKLLQP